MDFRLRAFIAVAEHLNFTKAAQELHISQPAVSKHIQELESTYGVQLFERAGSRVVLTEAGEVFIEHARRITENYRTLQLDMGALSGSMDGTLRIGASTTIAQYVLPEIVARLLDRHPQLQLRLTAGNSEQIERAVTEHRIDIGLVESISRHAGLHYTPFADDQLVVVHSTSAPKPEFSSRPLGIESLRHLPLVMRENGSGTLEVIEKALAAHHIKLSELNILLRMDSTEGIKAFLQSYPTAYAIISTAALRNELSDGRLEIAPIERLDIRRQFSIVTAQGQQSRHAELFARLLTP